jgi:hypothetical protein
MSPSPGGKQGSGKKEGCSTQKDRIHPLPPDDRQWVLNSRKDSKDQADDDAKLMQVDFYYCVLREKVEQIAKL